MEHGLLMREISGISLVIVVTCVGMEGMLGPENVKCCRLKLWQNNMICSGHLKIVSTAGAGA